MVLSVCALAANFCGLLSHSDACVLSCWFAGCSRSRGQTVRRIRTGVVGYGLAGRVFHAPFVQSIPSLELAVIVQRTGDTAKEAYPHAQQMRTLDELLASDVELVVIGTPSPTHYALSKQALLAGKHVVCDKPVTTTLAQAEDLEATAKAQGKLLFPFQNRRWDGDFITMRDLIVDGEM